MREKGNTKCSVKTTKERESVKTKIRKKKNKAIIRKQVIADINSAIPINTWNTNGLNTPIRKQRSSEWIKKQNPTICFLQDTCFKCKDT